jgi:hypothetical protein
MLQLQSVDMVPHVHISNYHGIKQLSYITKTLPLVWQRSGYCLLPSCCIFRDICNCDHSVYLGSQTSIRWVCRSLTDDERSLSYILVTLATMTYSAPVDMCATLSMEDIREVGSAIFVGPMPFGTSYCPSLQSI